MKRFLYNLISIFLILSVTLTACAKPEEKNPEVENQDLEVHKDISLPSFADLVERLKPSVVNISTTSVVRIRGFFPFESPFGEHDPFEEFFRRFFGEVPQREYRQRGLGSGFIISKDGYIVTNNHVVERAKEIQVILEDGQSYDAKVVGKDPKTDLALLKINPKKDLKAVTFGDSDSLRIGDWVIAIGNPFGLGHTVTAGIVSAKGRSLGLGQYDDFIQTDAPINPGNSGGPLFNLKGEVVGVNTAIVAGGQGIGFAIPSNMAKYVIEQLKTKGRVIRGWLGVLVQQVTPEIAESLGLKEPQGALVSDVTPGSPAEKAGIKRGDVIVEFDGHKIKEMPDLPKLVAITPPGKEVEIKIIRQGQQKELKLRVGELKEERFSRHENISNRDIGLSVSDITPEIASRYGLKDRRGVVVTDVERGSVAAMAGFQPGDIILEINGEPITSTDDYTKVLERSDKEKPILFLVKRGENTIYIALKVE
ncbi:Periplasmic serine endoprotease DegP [bacterium HR37]|nr:Periplasmic serine endoprotease DegP [bacterium HR37]